MAATLPPAILAPPYLGQVATRCILPDSLYTPHKQMMSVRQHRARDAISAIAIVVPNFYMSSLVEQGLGATATVTASIEYPAGTFSQIKFGGSASGTVPDGGVLKSDMVTVAIPDGASFWVRIYYTNTVGIPYVNGNTQIGNSALGFSEGLATGASGVADQTMSGTVTFTDAVSTHSCLAILAYTTKPSVFALGDSRVFGLSDTLDTSGNVGEVCRSVGGTLAYINAGVSSDQLNTWITNSTVRRSLAAYCSHVVCNLGGADLNGSARTATQIFADLQTVKGLFGTKPFFPCTSVPQTSSTDSWATTANQTVLALESRRTGLNDLIRAMPRCIDLADVMEAGRNTGKWVAPPLVPSAVTTDGVHENLVGHNYLMRSRVIRPEMFTR